MATSSILGGEHAPVQSTGRDTGALGPSDTSDTGSDVQNEHGFDALDPGEVGGEEADLLSDTDASGTGERGAAVHDNTIVEGADIAPDRVGVFGGADPDVDGSDAGRLAAADLESLVADPQDADDDGSADGIDDDDSADEDNPGLD